MFEGKGACLSCHRVNDRGSRKAPDLTDIGAVRSAGSLERSLRDPNSQMMPINRPVRAVTRDGKVINGRRLNEDTYTVQLTDDEERLHSLSKADLREYTISTKSTMPSYEKELTRGRTGRRRVVSAFTERPMTMRRRRILVAVSASSLVAGSSLRSARAGARSPTSAC